MTTLLTETNTEYLPKRWEEPACPFCASEQRSVLERFGPDHRYTYVRCGDCRLTYLHPRPAYDEDFVRIAYEAYTPSLDDVWTGTDFTEHGRREYAKARVKVAQLVAACPTPPRSYLEIGCATGLLVKAAGDAGLRASGVDISTGQIELGRAAWGLDIAHGDWMDITPRAPVDLIYCSHTIEHVPNPLEWMTAFRERMHAGSTLVLEVPNMNSLDRLLRRRLKDLRLKRDRWARWRTPDHLFEPCEQSLDYLCAKTGFRILDKRSYSRKKEAVTAFERLFHRHLRLGTNLRYILTVRP